MPSLEPINSTTYRILSGRDEIQLGDIAAAQCLGHLKYLRNRGSQFILSHPGTPTGLVQVDAPNGIIRIPYGNTTVELTAHDPDSENPDGRAEFNVILNSKPTADANGEYWQTLNFETSGLNVERTLGLDEEYDQTRCVEDWGEDHPGTFSITPTEIRAFDGTLLKSKAEHIVHSILGTALQNNHDKSNMGINKNNGLPMSYVRVSRDHLRLPRRELVDDRGKTARIEDIQIVGNQLKFKLPAQFIKTAKYPVRHTTGADPAYTQKMDSWLSTAWGGSDGVWGDYDIYTNKGVPKGAVAEIVLSNSTTGTENALGVRTDGSSLLRYANIHEAEGDGQTHCRMFVVCHATTGLIECYHSDVSDADYFYLVGYWENVSFTEAFSLIAAGASAWEDQILVNGASCIHPIITAITAQDVAVTNGVRTNNSALERKLLQHESEAGGMSLLDFLVKADANKVIETYSSSTPSIAFYDTGYFGSEMDFVELWQNIPLTTTNWEAEDLTAYLDQDGRVVDFLLVHSNEGVEVLIGVRGGDDAATARCLWEHEAESAGAGGEYTGFGMSAQSNASGVVNLYSGNAGEMFMLTGYFKPTVSTTPVSDTIQAIWDTRAKVPDTSQMVWSVRKTVSDAAQFIWNVEHKVATDTVQLIWNVRKALADTSQSIWHVRTKTPDTLQSVWNVRKLIGKSSQKVWNVKAAILDSMQAVWDVKKAILDSSQYVWGVRTMASDTLEAKWDVRTAVSDTLQSIWDVRKTVADASQLVWNVLAKLTVSDTVELIWNVRKAIVDSSQMIWDTRAKVPNTLQAVWNVRKLVSKTSQEVWNVREVISDSMQSVWNVKEAIIDSSQFIWDTRGLATDVIEAKWNVRKTVFDSLQSIWNVRKAVSDSTQVVWNVRAIVTDTSQFIWNVLAGLAVSDTIQLVWSARSKALDSLSSVWSVRGITSKSSQLVWNLRTIVTDSAQAIWNVREGIPDSMQVVWNVRSKVLDTISPVWNVKSLVTKPSQFIWNVLSSVSVSDTIQLVWNVRKSVSDSMQSIWNVKKAILDGSQLIWDVRGTALDSTETIWDVRVVASDTLLAVWNVRSLTAKGSQFVWNVEFTGRLFYLSKMIRNAFNIGKDARKAFDMRTGTRTGDIPVGFGVSTSARKTARLRIGTRKSFGIRTRIR